MEYRIYGEIVDSEAQKCSPEDVCPVDFSEFSKTVPDNSTLDIHLNSCGGSCYAGFTIANTIKSLKARGIKTIAHIDGIAASIATVIVCACDEIMFPKASFLMMHNAWGMVVGNSADLRKEADVMDQMNKSIMSFYKGKFDLSEDELKEMMDNETWISGADAEKYKLHCTVIDSEVEFNIAAKLDKKNFKHIPKAIMEHLDKVEVKEVEETEVEQTEVKPETEDGCTEEKKDEVVEETSEEDNQEEQSDEQTSEDEEEKISVKDCEKRVSGMQSTMQNKINTLTTSYENKIKEFQDEIKAKDEELSKLKDELTSLKTQLDASTKELSKTASALADKTDKLAALNAGVLAEREVVDWRNLHGKDFFDYLKKNNIR